MGMFLFASQISSPFALSQTTPEITATNPPPSNSSEFEMKPLNSKQWSSKEDQILKDYIQRHGATKWDAVGIDSGLNRTGKSCRLRWLNHLKPGVKKGPFSDHERELVLQMHSQFGNKWAKMAKHLPGRSDNDIKNFWHTQAKKTAGKEAVKRAGVSLSSTISCDMIYDPQLWDSIEAGTVELPSVQYDQPLSLGGAPFMF